jgi:hypothetical protein
MPRVKSSLVPFSRRNLFLLHDSFRPSALNQIYTTAWFAAGFRGKGRSFWGGRAGVEVVG